MKHIIQGFLMNSFHADRILECGLLGCLPLGLNPEATGSMSFRNVSVLPEDYTAQRPRNHNLNSHHRENLKS
jgi:hypothetical protein